MTIYNIKDALTGYVVPIDNIKLEFACEVAKRISKKSVRFPSSIIMVVQKDNVNHVEYIYVNGIQFEPTKINTPVKGD